MISTSLRPSFFKTALADNSQDNIDAQNEPEQEYNKWSADVDRLLRRWKMQVLARQIRHRTLARRHSFLHYAIGLTFNIIQAMVATGNFFQAFNTNSSTGCNNSSQWVLLTMGIMGAVSTVVSAVFMFTNNQARSEEHSTASANYEKLHRNIESVLSIPVNMRGDPIDIIREIRIVYDDVSASSPPLAEDPIPGGMLYTPLVAKPPTPGDVNRLDRLNTDLDRESDRDFDRENGDVELSMRDDVPSPQGVINLHSTHASPHDDEDLRNLSRLVIEQEHSDEEVVLPFDIDDAIHRHNTRDYRSNNRSN